MKEEIRALADLYAAELKRSIDERVTAMEQDDRSFTKSSALPRARESSLMFIRTRDGFSTSTLVRFSKRQRSFASNRNFLSLARFACRIHTAKSKAFWGGLPGGQRRFGNQVA
jgi:hypothetical protein